MRQGASRTSASVMIAAIVGAAAAGCEAELAASEPATGWVRGRLTDVAGAPLAELEISVDETRVRSDRLGRFELRTRAGREARLSVQSEMYSATTLPVWVAEESGAQVELTVKPRRVIEARERRERRAPASRRRLRARASGQCAARREWRTGGGRGRGALRGDQPSRRDRGRAGAHAGQ